MVIRNNTKFKSIELKKEQLTATIIQLMTDVGWEDISSLPSTDGHVMFSKGEDGLQSITIQISDSYTIAAANSMATTNTRYGAMRMVTEYKPGVSGKAGTTVPATDSWIHNVMFSRAGYGNMGCRLYYSINKDRAVLVIEDLFLKDCMWLYYGKPRPSYSKSYHNQNTVMCFSNNRYIGSVIIAGLADTTIKTQTAGILMLNDTGRSTNANGDLMLSEMGIAHKESGFIGYIDGLYALKNTFIQSTTTGNRNVVCGDKTLKIIRCSTPIAGTSWVNSSVEVPVVAFELEEEHE